MIGVEQEVLDNGEFFLIGNGHTQGNLRARLKGTQTQSNVVIALEVFAHRLESAVVLGVFIGIFPSEVAAVGFLPAVFCLAPFAVVPCGHPQVDFLLELGLEVDVDRFVGLCHQVEVHSGIAVAGHVILGLFAVGACGDCIADDRIFCQIQRCVILVPALELSVFVKCGLSAHGAHEDVLAIERIVVAQMIDLLHILVYHVADRQSIGIFISGNGLCSTIFVGIVVCPACFICRIQTAVLITAFPAIQHILDTQQRVRNFGVAVIAGIVAVHAVTQGFNEIDGTGIHDRTGV